MRRLNASNSSFRKQIAVRPRFRAVQPMRKILPFSLHSMFTAALLKFPRSRVDHLKKTQLANCNAEPLLLVLLLLLLQRYIHSKGFPLVGSSPEGGRYPPGIGSDIPSQQRQKGTGALMRFRKSHTVQAEPLERSFGIYN